ncbi:MAG: phage Gp37/Gp68 family protein [Gammaproteobacteria bacterium]|nr:phage Gp37/Gp68 family protein [Gammaproteobacteria bacterium]
MSDKTGIAWTESTWNPVTGCTKVSPGCKHCYAERDWGRLAANPNAIDYFGRAFTDVRAHVHRLDQPLRWQRPRRIFVNSMSDLFHESVPDEFIDEVLAVMTLTPRHTYQVLTKRPERMVAYFQAQDLYRRVLNAASALRVAYPKMRLNEVPVDNPASRFAPHIWWGVSVENQEAAEARIPLLLSIPVAVHWVSAEPLLGPVNLTPWLRSDHAIGAPILSDLRLATSGASVHVQVHPETPPTSEFAAPLFQEESAPLPATTQDTKVQPRRAPYARLDWVVVGGESGSKARPFDGEWVRTLLADCHDAQVPVFVKQMGGAFQERGLPVLLAHRAGADPDEWPADLRVREYLVKESLAPRAVVAPALHPAVQGASWEVVPPEAVKASPATEEELRAATADLLGAIKGLMGSLHTEYEREIARLGALDLEAPDNEDPFGEGDMPSPSFETPIIHRPYGLGRRVFDALKTLLWSTYLFSVFGAAIVSLGAALTSLLLVYAPTIFQSSHADAAEVMSIALWSLLYSSASFMVIVLVTSSTTSD